jgi:FMN phosphatase YigB (HAD superfamily)
MRFAFKNRAAYFEAKFSNPHTDPVERQKASLQAEAAQELLLGIPPDADKLADESWARFPQLAAEYDEALRAFQSARERLAVLSSGSSQGSNIEPRGTIGDDDIPF